MHRLLSAPVVPVVASALLVAGCSADAKPDSPPPPTIGSSSSAPTSTPPSAKPKPTALPTATPAAAKLHESVLGRNAAKTPEEKAAVAAWMGYWNAVTDTYFTLEPSRGLDTTARNKALTEVLDYLAKLKVKKQHVVGWTRDNVTQVRVNGTTAVLQDCARNSSFAVDRSGHPTENPPPYYLVTGVLQKQQGAWHVLTVKSVNRTTSCLG